jgi:hypothetical protein
MQLKSQLLLVMFLMLSEFLKAQNVFEIYNNTNKDVYAAYAYWDSPNTCWTSRGWIKIVKYSTTNVDLGSYVGDFYIHGQQGDKFWGYGFLFCIDPKDQFQMRYSDQINCQKNKRGFTKTIIHNGLNKWIFNP